MHRRAHGGCYGCYSTCRSEEERAPNWEKGGAKLAKKGAPNWPKRGAKLAKFNPPKYYIYLYIYNIYIIYIYIIFRRVKFCQIGAPFWPIWRPLFPNLAPFLLRCDRCYSTRSTPRAHAYGSRLSLCSLTARRSMVI